MRPKYGKKTLLKPFHPLISLDWWHNLGKVRMTNSYRRSVCFRVNLSWLLLSSFGEPVPTATIAFCCLKLNLVFCCGSSSTSSLISLVNSALHNCSKCLSKLLYFRLSVNFNQFGHILKQNSFVHMDQRMLLSKGNVKNTSRLPHATKDTPLCDLLLKQGWGCSLDSTRVRLHKVTGGLWWCLESGRWQQISDVECSGLGFHRLVIPWMLNLFGSLKAGLKALASLPAKPLPLGYLDHATSLLVYGW